ncbi:hypothetical protein COU75_01530 [Candidatus Peregrinibacteria bacterium CG10_big_fil_rev_8_21_14_0_10_42_8]|nr:MAG: hypothetical protein COU75_01530 [Candidatus Peregrinibacteria bacterium CG10_big_fil_rev_8_21_14_0_10_42_8]
MTSAELTISDETKQTFPELVEMIVSSESMNNEERQYWINILPIMTPEQMKNLHDILTNEKVQLAAIDKKYAKKLTPEEQSEHIKNTELNMQKKREERKRREENFESKDEIVSEDLLKKIEDL